MSVDGIIQKLVDLGIGLSVTDNGDLRVTGSKGKLDADTKQELAAHKQLLIERLKFVQVIDKGPITSNATADRFLLTSSGQESLFMVAKLLDNASVYNLPMLLRLKGVLNVSALEQALRELIKRHEVLRTHFIESKAGVCQVANECNLSSLHCVDLSELESDKQLDRLSLLNKAEVRHCFELTRGPLLRLQLIKLDSNHYILQFNIHHILFDGWSGGIFIHELGELYKSALCGSVSSLPPLPFQYRDYAQWERKWLAGIETSSQTSYWKKQLLDLPDLLLLPTDRPRLLVQRYRGSRYTFQLPVDLVGGLRILSQESGTTLFMTLFAAFNVFLYRYSGQADFAVGTPFARRNHPGLDKLIGYFVNMLVLRSCVEQQDSFSEALKKSKATILGASQHQDLPFDKVVELIKPNRSLSYSPLFQVVFALQNLPAAEYDFPQLDISSIEQNSETTMFDLSLIMSETDDGLVGNVEYSSDLFDAETIARMMDNFSVLLGSVVAQPESAVNSLNLINEKEKEQLLSQWGRTGADRVQDITLHELFERQVNTTPNSTALVFEGEQLTYRALNKKANQLAYHIREVYFQHQRCTLTSDSPIALYIDRSFEMVISILAVLKSMENQ